MDEVKGIVFRGLHQGWSYRNIVEQIAHLVATERELDLLMLWIPLKDIPELEDRAEKLYADYREEYYERGMDNERFKR